MAQASLGPERDLPRRIRALEEAIKGLATRDVLQNSSIGIGGLTISDGGSLAVTGGGSVEISGGGTLLVDGVDITDIAVNSADAASTAVTIVGSGWATGSRPQVTIATSTGSLKVTVSALVAAGTGGSSMCAATFSITGQVARGDNVTGFSGGSLVAGRINGVFAYNGMTIAASFSMVVHGLPVNTDLTVVWEFLGVNGGNGYGYPQILVEVVG